MTALVLVVTLLALGSLVFTAQPAAAQELQGSGTLTVSYPATVLEGDSETCASSEEREMARAKISNDTREILRDVVIPTLGMMPPCGGPGWTLAASLNMTDPAQNCPSAWDEQTENGKRVCFRQPIIGGSCDSVIYTTSGQEYTHICGRVTGYQKGHTDAFGSAAPGTIDNYYVEGISVTHGPLGNRTHIWTFAAGIDEVRGDVNVCPCDNPNTATVPTYVGDNYFCETGVPYPDSITSGTLYVDDPLWDGDGCGPNSDCCSFNAPPWFTVKLNVPTTDDIEVRNCGDSGTSGEDVGIEIIELYIR